jgi:hypothetical protein
MDKNKTIMIIALISIVLCGCPGCALLIPGINAFTSAVGSVQTGQDLLDDLGNGFLSGGWMICLSGLLVLVPFVLVIFAVVKRGGIKKVDDLEPTGVSKDDPIPPTA